MPSELGYTGTLTCGTEVQYAKDVNVDLNAAEVDDTSRADAGWQSRRAGLRSWGVTFDMVKKTGDSVYQILLNAYKNGTMITGVSVVDEQGDAISGNCYVTNLGRAEPLGGVVSVPVTLVGNGAPTFS